MSKNNRPKKCHDFRKCPQCGGVMVVSFKYSFGEYAQTDSCKFCGNTKFSKMGDGVEAETKKGCGLAELMIGERVESTRLDEIDGDVDEWVMRCKNNPEVNWDISYITRWNEDDQSLELIHGKMPEAYDGVVEKVDSLIKGDTFSIEYGPMGVSIDPLVSFGDSDIIPF